MTSFMMCLTFGLMFSCTMFFLSNPIYIILNFLSIMMISCILFFYIGLEFLPLITMLVYVGAMALMFLLAILLLNIKSINVEIIYLVDNFKTIYYLLLVLVIKSIYPIFYYIFKKVWINKFFFSEVYISEYSEMVSIYSDYCFFISLFSFQYILFIIVGLMLLFCMICSISLCLDK